MLTILEGMDNSGKSTLAMKLHETFNVPIVKPPSYNKLYAKGGEQLDHYVDWMFDIFNQTRPTHVPHEVHYLFDRHPLISTPVYEKVLFNRNSVAMHPLFGKLTYAFSMNRPLIIYCCPPADTILNFGEREQMKGVRENGEKLLQRYEVVMDQLTNSGFDVVKYDYTKKGADKAIIQELNKRMKNGSPLDQSTEAANYRCMTYFMFNYAPGNIKVTDGRMMEAVQDQEKLRQVI